MPSNHNKANASNETAASATPATNAQALSGEESTNLAEYVQQVQFPIYAAPVAASLSFPLVQYAKKVNVVSGRKATSYTGYHIAVEQSVELDDILEQQGVPQVRVRHYNGSEDSYWQFDTLKGYFLCTAIPQFYGPEAWRESGIAYVWNEYATTYMGGSQLQCIFFAKGLLEFGYTSPLVFTLSRTVTEHFLNKVLRRQEAMLNVVKKALRKQGKPDALAFYAYWVELIKATEEISVKNGGSYYPPATTITAPLTVSYVIEHQTPPAHIEIIESFLPTLPQWAEAASARLLMPPRDNGTVAPEEPSTQEPTVTE